MRDERLYPYYAKLSSLKGVGPKIEQALDRLLEGDRVLDLLLHLPERWIDRKLRDSFADTEPGEIATVKGTVTRHMAPKRRSMPYRIRLQDDSGFLTITYFQGNGQYLTGQFPLNKDVIVSGKIDEFNGERQILHPDHVMLAEGDARPPSVEPVYGLTAGLTNKRVHGFVQTALEDLDDLPEWQDPHLLKQKNWPGFVESLRMLHMPETYDPEIFEIARERLAYDEALAREAVFAAARKSRQVQRAMPYQAHDAAFRKLLTQLPFEPTSAQIRAYADIVKDTAEPFPMRRMVQGDVGSGKTLVAAFAAHLAAENGHQTAMMAPTEVLARQLYKTVSDILKSSGIRFSLLTGQIAAKERKETLAALESGEIQVAVGTHALFQESVVFANLGLVVVDEQHRFGVMDRAKLSSKGIAPHLLVMSATPIPRTLAMTVNGDLDVSIIDEKPAGRQAVDTRTLPDARVNDVIEALERALSRGEKAFWVCPKVDAEDEDSAVVARHAMLSDLFKGKVSLVHGRLSGAEKDEAIERFRTGASQILVATTVIEVGVDIPDATIMVIERAESFGLSQLHQLRGRVGRGDQKATCLLIYHPPLTENAKLRLDTLRKTDDGFKIAEIDYKIRGPGDILGLRQSGAIAFRVIDLDAHSDLLPIARQDARLLIEKDPDLTSYRGKNFMLLKQILGPNLTASAAK